MYDRIAFIAPYEDLKKIADEAMGEMGIFIDTYVGDLQRGVNNAIKAKKEGKKIVISRGGTARVIQEQVDIPVVEIKVTGYDLLRVLNKYKYSKKKVAVIGYGNVISGARVIADILGFNVEYFPIDVEHEVVEKVQLAYDLGIDVIIGDTISVRTANSMGMEYELIKSGKEAIINAYEEAQKLYEAIERESEKKQRYKTIVNFIEEGIIAVNKNEEVILYNPVAEKIFQIPKDKVMYKKASDVIPNTRIPNVLRTGKPELGYIQYTGNATNRVPIIVEGEVKGVVVTFQDITRIQEVEQRIREELHKKGLTAKKTFDHILGESKIIKKAIELSKKYAKTDSTILLCGESGTGKEVFAQAIHNYSSRRNKPFVAINCAAIPGNLLESELFGYAEGAFTGARKGGRKGLFEMAHGVTIFLDEISEMDIKVQARILRVIQEMEVMRIGDDRIIPIDVRIISATNKDLEREVKRKSFRNDLYYRINVLIINIPPLREREGDIEVLAKHFIEKYSRLYNKTMNKLSDNVVEVLKRYYWYGNVRELENVIAKLVIVGEEEISKKESAALVFKDLLADDKSEIEVNLLEGSLKEIELKIIKQVLEEENYNKTKTAERLRITRVTLNNKLKDV
ncbi:PAS domain-containing protein [Alkaliphilus pronyensis]|uniref:PAS domain-containing protein n=1 Tax=Alkaliphilus pronyensis TaxID=1482732 RepID=A0A6I0F972_9FIRM|nr:sigma 54-interacting transcriptional regulator [Alkaliphilus pronyensis]KAB3536962.1 PAS domain-containing protein [Alkaliphilus pronyensis]